MFVILMVKVISVLVLQTTANPLSLTAVRAYLTGVCCHRESTFDNLGTDLGSSPTRGSYGLG